MFKPRPRQQQVLTYKRGKMGVSAVPGSGKTATLSYLAARLVATVDLADNQEILVVTLVKSAVGNFSQSMARYLKAEFNLLPWVGYRVRTLHGLANDIVRERPGLVGLSDSFNVIDERVAEIGCDSARLEPAHELGGGRNAHVGPEQRNLEPLPGVLVSRIERRPELRHERAPALCEGVAQTREESGSLRVLVLAGLGVAQQLGPGPRHALP